MIPEAVQYNFDLLTMSTWCSKYVEAWNKLIVKQIFCIKLVNTKIKVIIFIKRGSFCKSLEHKVKEYLLARFGKTFLFFTNTYF